MSNSRAEMAEALMVAAIVEGDETYHKLLGELRKEEQKNKELMVKHFAVEAESKAFQRLSDEILNEARDPNRLKRLSDPENAKARAEFLHSQFRFNIGAELNNRNPLSEEQDKVLSREMEASKRKFGIPPR